jgi:hypothetical protein
MFTVRYVPSCYKQGEGLWVSEKQVESLPSRGGVTNSSQTPTLVKEGAPFQNT